MAKRLQVYSQMFVEVSYKLPAKSYLILPQIFPQMFKRR